MYRSASADTMQSLYVANPALAGGVLGGLFFALLTLCDCARTSRCRVEVLCDAAVSPLTAALARLMALLGTAALTLALTLLTWLPWTAHTVGAVFDGGDYLLAYLILMGLALPLCILLAGAAWQFTRRFDLSLVLVAALAALSLTIWRDNWQLCWLNPCVWALSDDFSNFRILRSAAYMRLTWLLGLAGLWALSYLCIRRYGRGPLGSLARTARRVYRPLLAAALLLCCGWSCAAQPFIDHSNPDLSAMTFLTMEPLEGVACLRRSVQVTPDTRRGHGGGYGLLPAPEYHGAGADGGPRRHPRLHHLQRPGQRGGGPLLGERLPGVQRGQTGGRHPGRGAGGADPGVRRLPPGEHAHHAREQGAQRRIPLSGERGPLSPPDERDARRRRLSRHN
ncbi:MAG: hypothetical protein ACLRWQ_22730 [Flavonifractor plautii]